MKVKITLEHLVDSVNSEWEAVHRLDMLLIGVLNGWKIVKVERIKEA